MIDKKRPISQIQNRKQKRRVEKALKINGRPKEELNKMINVINLLNGFTTDDFLKYKEYLLEGDKVKLHVAKIKSHPSWESYQQEYKDFIESNEDVEFTVEYDERHRDKPSIVTLKEDLSRQKWQFADCDLLVFDKKDGKFKELYKIKEDINDKQSH